MNIDLKFKIQEITKSNNVDWLYESETVIEEMLDEGKHTLLLPLNRFFILSKFKNVITQDLMIYLYMRVVYEKRNCYLCDCCGL